MSHFSSTTTGKANGGATSCLCKPDTLNVLFSHRYALAPKSRTRFVDATGIPHERARPYRCALLSACVVFFSTLFEISRKCHDLCQPSRAFVRHKHVVVVATGSFYVYQQVARKQWTYNGQTLQNFTPKMMMMMMEYRYLVSCVLLLQYYTSSALSHSFSLLL